MVVWAGKRVKGGKKLAMFGKCEEKMIAADFEKNVGSMRDGA